MKQNYVAVTLCVTKVMTEVTLRMSKHQQNIVFNQSRPKVALVH